MMANTLLELLAALLIFGALIWGSTRLGFPEFVRVVLILIFVIYLVLALLQGPFLF